MLSLSKEFIRDDKSIYILLVNHLECGSITIPFQYWKAEGELLISLHNEDTFMGYLRGKLLVEKFKEEFNRIENEEK